MNKEKITIKKFQPLGAIEDGIILVDDCKEIECDYIIERSNDAYNVFDLQRKEYPNVTEYEIKIPDSWVIDRYTQIQENKP